MGLTILFTHLKIILLQCFSVFSFQLYPNGPLVYVYIQRQIKITNRQTKKTSEQRNKGTNRKNKKSCHTMYTAQHYNSLTLLYLKSQLISNKLTFTFKEDIDTIRKA